MKKNMFWKNVLSGFNQARDYDVIFKQILANIPVILLSTNNGLIAGYSAILLPQLEKEDAALHPTKNQEPWIASLVPLLMAISCIFSGVSTDRCGRRSTMMMSSVMAAIGWILIYLSPDINTLLIGRIITGLSINGVSLSVFIGEISHPKYRGFFLNTIAFGIAFGTFVVHLLGTLLDWRMVALILTFPPLISAVVMIFIPDSHIWYINKDRVDKAKECFLWFRGNSEKAKTEWELLVNERLKQSVASESCLGLLKKCKSERFIKPFLLSLLLFALSQVNGSNALIFYTVQVMQSAVEGIDEYTSTLIVDAVRTIMSVVASVLIKKCKVRSLAMISGFGTTLSLLLLSLFIYLASVYPEMQILKIVPLLFFTSYIIFVSVGLASLAWILLGEIFPPETKGLGGGISSTINFIGLFVVVRTMPDLLESIGSSGMFATYAVCTFIGTVLAYFFLPETKGKTLEEIQKCFISKPKVVENKDGENDLKV